MPSGYETFHHRKQNPEPKKREGSGARLQRCLDNLECAADLRLLPFRMLKGQFVRLILSQTKARAAKQPFLFQPFPWLLAQFCVLAVVLPDSYRTC